MGRDGRRYLSGRCESALSVATTTRHGGLSVDPLIHPRSHASWRSAVSSAARSPASPTGPIRAGPGVATRRTAQRSTGGIPGAGDLTHHPAFHIGRSAAAWGDPCPGREVGRSAKWPVSSWSATAWGSVGTGALFLDRMLPAADGSVVAPNHSRGSAARCTRSPGRVRYA